MKHSFRRTAAAMFAGVTMVTGCAAVHERPAVSVSPHGLGALRGQVAEQAGQGRYPGAVFAVAKGRRLLDLEAVGVANIDTGKSMRVDSIFRTMSMTKPVTAVAVMMMVEEGKLKLDEPVASILPEYAGFGVVRAPPLTLRHLLTHSSGIGFGSMPMGPATLAERVRASAARKMTTPAGRQWAYSGFEGPDIIARMVEVVAGEPYDQFVKRRIFDPLGMKDTGYALTPEQDKRLVGLYLASDGKITNTKPPLPQPSYPSGGAGLYSTAPDYLRFAQMLANNGIFAGKRLLKPETIREMHRAQLPMGFAGLMPGMEWGLLMRRVGDSAAAKSPLPVGAYGWSGAYGTHFWIDPSTGLSAVWMINLANAGGAGSADALDFEKMVIEACRTDRRCAAGDK